MTSDFYHPQCPTELQTPEAERLLLCTIAFAAVPELLAGGVGTQTHGISFEGQKETRYYTIDSKVKRSE